jgi:hypothetical protein
VDFASCVDVFFVVRQNGGLVLKAMLQAEKEVSRSPDQFWYRLNIRLGYILSSGVSKNSFGIHQAGRRNIERIRNSSNDFRARKSFSVFDVRNVSLRNFRGPS